MRGHCLQSGRQALHVRGHHRQSGRQALHKNFQSGCSFLGRPSIVITTPLRTRDCVLVSRDADFCVITWTHQPLDIHVRYAHLQSSARAIATHKHVRQTQMYVLCLLFFHMFILRPKRRQADNTCYLFIDYLQRVLLKAIICWG